MEKRLYVQVKSAKTGKIFDKISVSKRKLDKLLTLPKIRAWAISLAPNASAGRSDNSEPYRTDKKFLACKGGCPIWEYLNAKGIVGHSVNGKVIYIASEVTLDRFGYVHNQHVGLRDELFNYLGPKWMDDVVKIVDASTYSMGTKITAKTFLAILNKVATER